MNNDIVLYANGKEYHCVLGCTITEEFNETLDSATLILDNVQKEDRLQINPYDFVRIKNIGDGYELDKEMLIDSFVETEKNISQHIYYYQIELMSETKLLEKKQLPNLTISHSERYGKKSIAQHIMNYMDLYVPKAKMLTNKSTLKWAYNPIITYDEDELNEKFGNECADMALSAPTLRQALTNLMLQNGCIPLVENRKLGWLDLTQKYSQIFDTKANGLNAMQRSNSSDSYVNALANMSEQLLDTDNEVISETVGFRDPDNVFIKQTENLKLHTSFPIYKVTKCDIIAPVDFLTGSYWVKAHNYGSDVSEGLPIFTMRIYDSNGNLIENQITTDAYKIQLVFGASGAEVQSAKVVYLTGGDVSSTPKYGYKVYKTQDVSITLNATSQTGVDIIIPEDIRKNEEEYWFYFIAYVKNPITKQTEKQSTMLCELSYCYRINADITRWEMLLGEDYFPLKWGYLTTNFTPCVVESAKRQLLDTNFTTMPSQTGLVSAETIAKWIYGTVSYSIGGQEITGFSQTYSQAQGWWKKDKTYFENILDALFKINYTTWYDSEDGYWKTETLSVWRTFLGNYEGAFELAGHTFYNSNFATILFDITYQPLNSMTHKTYKKESLFELEQLDNTATGLTDFDRFAKNSQQKVNRLGNDIMSINQTTDDANAIQPLNSLYEQDNALVFKRTIALNKNYIQVTYNLSKDYVIKNYFTSISTKYRAYEHIDYNQATIRKEHINVFVTLDTEEHTNMDDRLILTNTSAYAFFGGLLPHSESLKIRYALEQSVNEQGDTETVKYDISVVASDNSLSFVYQPWFNIGNGSYLTALTATEGGLPQFYQVWGSEYYEKRYVGFTSSIDWYNDVSDAGLLKIAKEPIVNNSYFTGCLINVMDDASSLSKRHLTQHKDEGEILNNTLQCTYINKCEDYFAFTEELIRCNPYACITQYGYANAIVLVSPKDYTQGWGACKNSLKAHPNQDGLLMQVNDVFEKIEDYVSISANGVTFEKSPVEVPLLGGRPYKIVHAYKNSSGEWEWVDIAIYKGDKARTLYSYVNDTNTLKVLAEDDNGVLRPMYEDDGTGVKKAKAL